MDNLTKYILQVSGTLITGLLTIIAFFVIKAYSKVEQFDGRISEFTDEMVRIKIETVNNQYLHFKEEIKNGNQDSILVIHDRIIEKNILKGRIIR